MLRILAVEALASLRMCTGSSDPPLLVPNYTMQAQIIVIGLTLTIVALTSAQRGAKGNGISMSAVAELSVGSSVV